MKNIWIISDTHFNHSNILKFVDDKGENVRAFDSLQEMNEIMIQNWNSVVRPGDLVYHLGDVFFGDQDWFKKTWPRLMGSKRLIVGNHDDVKFLACGGFFQKVMLWRLFKEHNMLLTHVPVHESNIRKVEFNVHGHIHQQESPTKRHINVCVEKTLYTPVHIEQVLRYSKE
jgi:calcineurin-like phosphoesterase family protein